MFSALVVATLLGANASAPPSPSRNAFCFNVGAASAVGFLGLTYARDLGSVLQLELGVGAGATGAQISLMPKLILAGSSASDRVLFGAGVSVGIPGAKLYPAGTYVLMPWINVDLLGYEHRATSGFDFLIAGGITTALRHATVRFCDECATMDLHGTHPQLRIAFGDHF